MAKITTTALVAALGAYFRKNDTSLIAKMYQMVDSKEFTTLVTGIKDELVSARASVSELLQAFQCEWTPKGIVVIDPVINKVRPLKMDFELECIEDLERTYEGYLIEEGVKASDQPFVKWLWENVVIQQLIEDIALNEALAQYAAPVSGVAGAASNSFDGYLTVIADLITSSALTPITVGALNATNIFDKTEQFALSIPALYRRKGGMVLMSDTNANLLFNDYRNTFPFSYATDKPFNVKLSNTNITVKGVLGMEGSDRFVFTPKKNFIRMIDVVDISEEGDINQYVEVQQDKRVICMFLEAKLGFGFRNVEELFVSDNA